MDWQNKIAITNYGTMAVLFAIGIIACIRARHQYGLSNDAERLVTGISLVCVWGVIHQTFWFTRWWLFANNDSRTEWFLEHSWLLVAPYFMAFIGSIMVAYALFRSRCFIYTTSKVRFPWSKGWRVWAGMIASLWGAIFWSIP